jgi:hypothetical protein
VRNRVTRKKSLKRSRSSSRTGGIKERRLNTPHQSAMIPPPSAASGAESFYSALGSPSPATTESQVEAEFERRGTMSLLTRAQPRKKRALPLSGLNVSSHTAPMIELTTTDSTVATKKRPIPLRTGSTDTETSTDYPTLAPSTVPTMRVPRFPAIAAHDSERSSMASSLAAVDNNHLDSRATQRSSATSQTLIVPSRFSRSSSNSASDSLSVAGRSSPSFEQLVDLLEDLAAKTPSVSGAPFEETETSRASSIIVPSLDYHLKLHHPVPSSSQDDARFDGQAIHFFIIYNSLSHCFYIRFQTQLCHSLIPREVVLRRIPSPVVLRSPCSITLLYPKHFRIHAFIVHCFPNITCIFPCLIASPAPFGSLFAIPLYSIVPLSESA